MSESRTQLGPAGRVVIPAAWRRRLGLRPGDPLILLLEEDSVRILTPAEAVRRAQGIVRRHVGQDRSLSEELLRDRRREADGE
jgi:AbrB family looped-hinge helix DNA binding protein